MKKIIGKLKLEELQVQSFITNLDEANKETIQGGTNTALPYTAWNGPAYTYTQGSSAPCAATVSAFSVGFSVGQSINTIFSNPTAGISDWVGTYFSNDGGC